MKKSVVRKSSKLDSKNSRTASLQKKKDAMTTSRTISSKTIRSGTIAKPRGITLVSDLDRGLSRVPSDTKIQNDQENSPKERLSAGGNRSKIRGSKDGIKHSTDCAQSMFPAMTFTPGSSPLNLPHAAVYSSPHRLLTEKLRQGPSNDKKKQRPAASVVRKVPSNEPKTDTNRSTDPKTSPPKESSSQGNVLPEKKPDSKEKVKDNNNNNNETTNTPGTGAPTDNIQLENEVKTDEKSPDPRHAGSADSTAPVPNEWKNKVSAMKKKKEKEDGQSTITDTDDKGKKDETPSTREKLGKIFNDVSERAKKTMKFISRPISDAAMRRFTKRVENRKRNDRALPKGEDAFPGSLRENKNLDSDKESQSIRASAESIKNNNNIDIQVLKSGNPVVTGNNLNGGKLFIHDKPFWMKKQKEKEDATEDDLPMNADVVLEVAKGKIKLHPMPNVGITLDPYAEMEKMKDKDAMFFNKDILFGNTVRTMINATDSNTLSERSSRSAAPKKEKKRQMNMKLPTKMTTYSTKKEVFKTKREKIPKKEK